MARIGFLGTGEIAAALVETLAGDGHQITLSHRSETVSQELVNRFARVSRAENQQVLDNSDIVFICLLADTARQVLPDLRFRPDLTVISVMARVSIAELHRLCAPTTDICAAIPLPPIRLGGTPLAIYPDNAVPRQILGGHAAIHACASETDLAAHFAATGILLPLLDQIDSAAGWLAGFTGDRNGATQYLAGLIGGYCRMLDQAPDLPRLRAGLNTEGGLNQTLARKLADCGAPQTLCDGLDSLRSGLNLPPKA
ncbi:MAG: NAD(P)-binding domain-containing protein [Paracoccus sp. (in: a-proteobacteria)]|uniref:NAD(P)-binding domain-containing protein n=1 Tax=Paracoccus sp. TaxID=267 RepID=UPI0026DF1860|nr:NAD(P)-binding domain-containing protein [Paracoccus sp. (in: a-proteobacteria)]MDO5631179.1 NAD(P)-binding domain-containing protein [Paracoccus sp. (in: a-proteobacteria)]